jgi:hypothetical protein
MQSMKKNRMLWYSLMVLIMLPFSTVAQQQGANWNWHTNGCSFNVNSGGHGSIKLEGISGSVMINGKRYSLNNARKVSGKAKEPGSVGSVDRASFKLDGLDCTWTWELIDRNGGLEVSATLLNSGSTPLEIGKWDMVHLTIQEGGKFMVGEIPGDVRFFRWLPWDMHVERLTRSEGSRHSENICLLYNPSSKQAFMSAFISMDRMHCQHVVDYSSDDGIHEYRATCSFGKFQLQPGQKLVSEKLRISFYDDPYLALEDWAARIHDSKRSNFAALPPVGLSSGAWIDAWNEQEGGYAEVSLDNARSVRAKLKGFDVDIFRVSTWTSLKEGIPGNWFQASERHFTHGFRTFLQEIQNLGFKPGVWMAPFWFFSEADGMLEKNRENLLHDCHGNPINNMMNWAGDLGDTIRLSRMHKYYLDGTHPKTVEFTREVFSHYRDLGIRFYMLDFLEVPGNACLYDPGKTPLEAASDILKVIRETATDDTHLQTAVASTPAFSGLINAARVGRDFGEGRPLQGAPLSDWRNATYVLHDYHYANTHYLVQNAAASYFTHRKLYINDLNVLTIDKPVPLEHARIAATVFGLCGTPLMLGDDFRRIHPDRLRMVKMCLPRTIGMPVPLDLFDHVSPDDYSRYLKLSVNTEWDSYTLVAVFNEDDTTYMAELDFERIGLDPDQAHQIYEFWTEEYCGTYKEKFDYIVPPHSCRLFRLSEARNHPWLLSSDMHIQQGAVEVEDLRWDPEMMCLSGRITRPIDEKGNLYLIMPRKMRVINDKGLWLMKDLVDMNVIIRKEISFESDHEEFELFFEPWEERYVTAKHLMPFSTESEWLDYVEKNREAGDTRVIE